MLNWSLFQFDPEPALYRKIMLTRGIFLQIRQVIFRFSTNQRKRISMENLKQSITSAMNDLSNKGYGTLYDGVFFKNPHMTAEELDAIGVSVNEYAVSLDTSTIYPGFSSRQDLYEKCSVVHDKLYSQVKEKE